MSGRKRPEEETFLRITNKDIYKSIQDLKEEHAKSTIKIVTRLDKTNGRVTLNRWIATTGLTLITAIVMFLIGRL